MFNQSSLRRVPLHRLLSCAILSLVIFHAPLAQATTNVDPINKYSWTGNIGWLNWAGDIANGAVLTTFSSGYVYSANVGWINIGDGTPENGLQYTNASATDFGINIDKTSDPNFWLMSGGAYGANIGWINFSVVAQTGLANRPRIERATGRMLGYAWSANVGWLSLDSSPTAQVIVMDTNRTAAKVWISYR